MPAPGTAQVVVPPERTTRQAVPFLQGHWVPAGHGKGELKSQFCAGTQTGISSVLLVFVEPLGSAFVVASRSGRSAQYVRGAH
jgi:hypothetical protein